MSIFATLLLRIENEGYVTQSKIGKSIQSDVDRWISIGALKRTIMKRGTRFSIDNQAVYASEKENIFPMGLEAATASTHSRRENVLVHKNAKSRQKTYPHIHLVPLIPSMIHISGEVIPLTYAPIPSSMSIAVLYEQLSDWHIKGKIVLIENQEPFLHSHRMFKDAAAIMWYTGRVNSILMEWIESQSMEILFCPDYDPVGIDEYSKMKTKLGSRVQLFLPDTLQDDFRFSTPDLLDKPNSRAILARLAHDQSLDADALKVLRLVQKNNAGLMQEYYF